MLELARSGIPEGIWLRAERQTGGRGRQGRVWVSPVGNFYGSTVVRVRSGYPAAATLALVAAVALEEVVRAYLPPPPLASHSPLSLRFPGDLAPFRAGAPAFAGEAEARGGAEALAGKGWR
jgi:BirA family biotin operon repressor/biotin-[acetyl-CoA-carboxylase] ligase